MEDRQRPPTDTERAALSERVQGAYAAGRIGEADRDIRLGNVRTAASVTELDLMSRDLDQLDASLGAATPSDPSPQGPYSTFDPTDTSGAAAVTVSAPRRAVVVLVSVVALLAVVGAGVAALVSFAGSDGDTSTANPAAEPGVPGTPNEDEVAASPEPADASYSLTAAGIRGFLRAYAQRFGTSRVVELTLYEKYAIVGVPVPGKARQEGWLFRDGTWTSFGGVRATFPGSVVVDTRRLAVTALVRNIARARTSLGVEQPSQAYVIVRFIRPPDQVPRVDIHVSNEFRESGYLATTLPGRVQRAFPYTR